MNGLNIAYRTINRTDLEKAIKNNADMKKERLTEINDLFSFAMILVVFGHSMIFGDFSKNPDWYLFTRKIIYSFHMYLFFFISGFLFIHTNFEKTDFSYLKFISKKAKRLMMPYFILISLAYLPRVYMSKYTGGNLNLDIVSYMKMFINPHLSSIYSYWFIFTLFIMFLFCGLFHYLITRKYKIASLITAIILMLVSTFNSDIDWFCLNYITGFLFYFWLGCLFYFIREKINKLNHAILAPALLLFVILANTFKFDLPLFMKIANVIIHLSGVFFSYCFIMWYKQSGYKFILFNFMAGYTYTIYLLSWFFHEGSAFLLHRILGYGFYAVFPVSFVIAIFFPVIIGKYIQKRFPKIGFVVGA